MDLRRDHNGWELDDPLPRRHKKRVTKAGPVVVVRSGGLGDFLLTLPLFRALRATGSGVTLYAHPGHGELIRDADLVSEIRSVDGPELASWGSEPCEALRERLRGARVLSFWPDPDGRLERAARTCGARDYLRLPVRPTRPPHVSLQMLRAAGLPAEPAVLEHETLGGWRGPGRSLWLHPGSGAAHKNAPSDEFVRRARDFDGPSVVLLGEAERAALDDWRRAFDGVEVEFLVSAPLIEVRERMTREAAAFVGNDSGPAHLAAALGVPTTAVFVSSDPEIWRPVGPRVQVV